jgi:hypothetical protein
MAYYKTKNPFFGKFLEGLSMEDVGIFYVNLVYFTAIWYILWPFGIFYEFWYIFSPFGMLYQEKSGNPGRDQCRKGTLFVHPVHLL